MALRSSWPSSLVMASAAANAGNPKTTPNARLRVMIVVLRLFVLPLVVLLDVTYAAQQLPQYKRRGSEGRCDQDDHQTYHRQPARLLHPVFLLSLHWPDAPRGRAAGGTSSLASSRTTQTRPTRVRRLFTAGLPSTTWEPLSSRQERVRERRPAREARAAAPCTSRACPRTPSATPAPSARPATPSSRRARPPRTRARARESGCRHTRGASRSRTRSAPATRLAGVARPPGRTAARTPCRGTPACARGNSPGT